MLWSQQRYHCVEAFCIFCIPASNWLPLRPEQQCKAVATRRSIYYDLCAHLCVCVCVFICVQFHSGSDPRTGSGVSAQEAQAQAILQQTKVHKLVHVTQFIQNCSLNVALRVIKLWLMFPYGVFFVFQLAMKGPPGPLGLRGRPGPLVSDFKEGKCFRRSQRVGTGALYVHRCLHNWKPLQPEESPSAGHLRVSFVQSLT